MLRVKSDSLLVRGILETLSLAIIVMAIIYLWNIVPIFLQFYIYILMGLGLPMVFLLNRAKGNSDFIPWYDLLLSALSLGIGIYFTLNARNIFISVWEHKAPTEGVVLGGILLALLLEATRRSFGWIIFAVCVFFVFLPMFSGVMPGPFQGLTFPLENTISAHVFGYESLIGPVGRVSGTLLIGFLLFAGVMQVTGGGKFFLDLVLSLFGRSRGAAAKVAVVSSAIFGSLSGSAVSNVLTTGTFTIPAMKRTGYSAYYAGAVEACASSGGIILPPVMGAVAFVMAELTQMSYWSICIASALPAILYFVVLFVQADAYAGRRGIKGLTKEEMPSFWESLKLCSPYLVAVAVLIWFMAFARLEARAPFYSIIAMLLASVIRKDTRPTIKNFSEMLMSSSRLIAEIMVLLYTLGVVAGSLSITGLAASFGHELLKLTEGSVILLPLLVMVIGYIFGMGCPGIAVYILLAITVAPAMTQAGFRLVPTHLFIMYVGNLSLIIPPVALAVITASKLAGETNIFRMGMVSMRLGMGLFVLPIMFLFVPGVIIGEASFLETLINFFLAIVGLSLMAMAFERYMIRIVLSFWQSILLGVIGFIITLLALFV